MGAVPNPAVPRLLMAHVPEITVLLPYFRVFCFLSFCSNVYSCFAVAFFRDFRYLCTSIGICSAVVSLFWLCLWRQSSLV